MQSIPQGTLQLLLDERFREAFVAIWCQAEGLGAANAWSRVTNQESVAKEAQLIRAQLEQSISLASVEQYHPLALLKALDEWLHDTWGAECFPRSEFYRVSVAAAQYWLIPGVQNNFGQHALARQPSNVHAWVKYHVVVPCEVSHGLKVSLSTLGGSDLERWKRVRQGASLRAGLAHFADEADVDYQINSRTKRLRVTEVLPRSARLASIERFVQDSVASEAHVQVFPEFTVDLEARRYLRTALRTQSLAGLPTPLLTVAGSFHELMGEGDFNTAPVLDSRGKVLWVHHKIRVLGDVDSLSEDVDEGHSVHLLVTPVGTHMVLICKDFLDLHQSVALLLQQVPVDWVWVPSYGDTKTIKAHLARAGEVARKSAASNIGIAQKGETKPDPIPGFGWQALANNSLAVPTGGGWIDFPLNPILSPSERRKGFILHVKQDPE
jgi:hypothetical protein